MKSFEKPVVVLNEMLMNESIAAACCYKLDGTVKKALNGGSISAGGGKLFGIIPSVLDVYGLVPPMPGAHYEVEATAICDGQINGGSCAHILPTAHTSSFSIVYYNGYGVDPWGTVLTAKNNALASVIDVLDLGFNTATGKFVFDGTGDVDFTGGMGASIVLKETTAHCDHGDLKCPWVYSYDAPSNDVHVGGTGTHLFAGTDWNVPHPAVQFNS